MTPALRLEGISKSFGQVKAVDGVSLDIEAGEIFSLLGPSGCGKTTTLRVIAGLESPDSGALFFGERPIVSVADGVMVPTHKRNLGMVFQSYAIWPHMTVFDNVAYPLRVRRVDRKKIEQRVLQTLELVGLAGYHDRQAPQLSGGQQQRVALARALVHEPSILLLDEPFSNLDAKLREQMRVQLKLLLRQVRITAVFVTHDQDEALSLSDRIAVMNAGRLEQIGPPKDVYERPQTAFVRDFLGRILLLAGVVEEVLEQQVSVRLPSLGATFLRVSAQESFAVGAQVSLAVRPEDVHVDDGSAKNCLEGRVETTLFAGDHYDCQVRIGPEQTLLLPMPRACPPAEGDRLQLAVAEQGITIWPRTSTNTTPSPAREL